MDRTCGRCGELHGKPRADGVELSVTHSGDIVGVATARVPVGMDVEQVGRSSAPEVLARYMTSEEERQDLAALSGQRLARAVLVAWTRKEAVTKATGEGLGVSFSSVTVSATGTPSRLTAWPYPQDPGTVSLFDLNVPPGTWFPSRSSASAVRSRYTTARRCWHTTTGRGGRSVLNTHRETVIVILGRTYGRR